MVTRSKHVLARSLQRLPCSSLRLGPPKGYYFGYEEFASNFYKTGQRKGFSRILIPSEKVFVGKPARVIGSLDPRFTQPFEFDSGSASLTAIPNGRLHYFPQAFITPDDHLLADVSCWYSDKPYDHLIFSQLRLAPVRRLSGRAFYFGGGSHYFHFLNDCVPRLHLLELAGYEFAAFDHVIMTEPRTRFEHELVDFLGIPRKRIVDPSVHQHLQTDEMFVCSGWIGVVPWAVRYLRHCFRSIPSIPAAHRRRVYISRRNAPYRRLVNEEEIVPLFRKRGFEIMLMEELSVFDQMQCFRDAEIVAGPGGAAFTNLCFAQPGVKVLDLRYSGYPDGDWASWWRLCDILGLRYYNLITETDRPGLDPTLADLKITPKEVELMLDTMLSD